MGPKAMDETSKDTAMTFQERQALVMSSHDMQDQRTILAIEIELLLKPKFLFRSAIRGLGAIVVEAQFAETMTVLQGWFEAG